MDQAGGGPAELSRFLVDSAARVGGSLDLQQTLDRVVESVVALLGFEVAVLNLVDGDGALEVVSTAGSAEVRAQLLGARQTRRSWLQQLEVARPIGTLRFVHHDDADLLDSGYSWIPDLAISEDPEAWHPLDALFAPLYDSEGELLAVLSVDLPVDGRQPSSQTCHLLELLAVQAGLALDNAYVHAKLARSERALRATFEQAPVGMAVFGPDRRIRSVNRAFGTFLGRSESELLGLTASDLSHPDDLEKTVRASQAVRTRTGTAYKIDKRYLHADGSIVWGRLSLTSMEGPDGEDQVLAQIEDITAEQRARSALEQQARTDALTGLANRHEVMAGLSVALRTGRQVAVLFCDVDHFKAVNDTFGHAAGDALLIDLANTLRDVLRTGDGAGRVGGDEFVVVLGDVADAADAVAVAERIRHATCRDIVSAGRRLRTSTTIGVALARPDQTAQQAMGAADRALYDAKREGRNRTRLA